MIVNNLVKSFDNKKIIENINFVLNEKDKVGLIGINGSGKSTLLKLLCGVIKPDSGLIKLNGEKISFLKQEINLNDYNLSVIDYIKKEIGMESLLIRLNQLQENLTELNMEEYGNVLEDFLNIDGYNFENNLEIIFNGLGLECEFNKKVSQLSGGEKIKVLLAVLLLSNKDIMLLDEPTNNLDLDSIIWLENYLSKLNCKMIIISHDEDFLNNITNKIFELSNGLLTEYNMSYSNYLIEKNNEYNRKLIEYNNAIERKKELVETMKETDNWVRKGMGSKKKKDNDKIASGYAKERTKKTASKISQTKRKIDKIEIPSDFKKKEEINFDISFVKSKGNKDINILNLVCGYDEFSTNEINLNIPFGSKLWIKGKNGCGKTTFVKTVLGEILPLDGNVYIGHDVRFGYIAQNTLIGDSKLTIFQYLTNGLKDIDSSKIFTILNKFHISYDEKDKKYFTLSPGERTRVNFAKLAINQVNVLVLDEITNHLDNDALSVLYDVLQEFSGTIIYISHNRKFLEFMKPDIVEEINSKKKIKY